MPSLGMAGVTIHRIVDVTGNAAVIGIRRAAGMTGQAGESLVIIRVRMTGRAAVPCVSPRRDWEPGMVERSLIERGIGRSMAGLACGRETGRQMVGIFGLFLVRSMTTVTILGRSLVNVVFVAGGAGQGRMDADFCKKLVVVEGRLVKRGIGRPMAGFACCREPGRQMIGIFGLFVVRAVTAVAILGRSLVNAVFMAGGAGQGRMDADLGKRLVVVEGPLVERGIGRPVAECAGGRKSSRDMTGILGLFVIRPMTGVAILGRSLVNVVLVAGGAVQRRVDADLGKKLIMVDGPLMERGIGRPVAKGAGGRKSGRPVIGFAGPFVIFAMTGVTIRRCSLERLILMAAVAVERPMGAVEGLPGPGGMVPGNGRPGRRCMAFFALVPEFGPVGIVLAANPMAVVAALRSPFDHSVQMTGRAGDGQMPALQGKIRRLMKPAGGVGPAGRSMAGGAGFLHRPLMRILMTGLAGWFQVEKGSGRMAFPACFGLGCVFSFEGEAGLFPMIETSAFDRLQVGVLPLMLGVADFAIAGDVPMHPFFRGDAVGDRLVTCQAGVGADLISRRVAFRAVCGSFQRGMGRGEGAGGRLLFLRGR